jgi:peptidoglycan/xylan/chitin deacetylase (PgdA/CDA1 family)
MAHPGNPILTALRGKGPAYFLKRVKILAERYGLTPARMDSSLQQLTHVLHRFNCQATLPVTAVVLARNPHIIQKYQAQGIEFIVHGYTHIDYSELTQEQQLAHLRQARLIFAREGVAAAGFRAPYLRREARDLNATMEALQFSYVSNQTVLWDVLDTAAFAPPARASYERAIAFYRPWHASQRPALPHLCGQIVEIPVSLPDDEMLLDRLGGGGHNLVEKAWRRILAHTHRRGELFTIQLHPERTALCADQLAAVLAEARQLSPSVWFARLDEIAAWWRARAATGVEINEIGAGQWQLSVAGPPGTTIMARGVDIQGPFQAWLDGYQLVAATACTIRAASRPFIGVAPTSSPAMVNFLREQGYLVQVSPDRDVYSIYLDRADFGPQDEHPLLASIEEGDRPLVRLGRWPHGARSVVCVTGDVDALTLWDYGLRLFGR